MITITFDSITVSARISIFRMIPHRKRCFPMLVSLTLWVVIEKFKFSSHIFDVNKVGRYESANQTCSSYLHSFPLHFKILSTHVWIMRAILHRKTSKISLGVWNECRLGRQKMTGRNRKYKLTSCHLSHLKKVSQRLILMSK